MSRLELTRCVCNACTGLTVSSNVRYVMAPTQTTSGTLLGRMVMQRLEQLGVPRRTFCIKSGISRQTLYEIEHQGKVNLMPATLKAIDCGCYWEPGTAARYATGDDTVDKPAEERIDEYIRRILERLSVMTIDELERESIWLEEELFGRNSDDMADSVRLIREAYERIIPSISREAKGTGNGGRGKRK